jgi:L-gulonate 5-dehydrogenase
MRYVVTTAPLQMELRSGPPPAASDGQAVVAVEAVGLCGSDYHLFDGTHPYASYPQIQGHEVTGVIAELEPGHSGPLRVGQRVAIEPLLPCGSCFACRRGRSNCCERLRVMGAHVAGGLADLFAVPVARLYSTGDLPPDTAVLTEPLSIGLQAVSRAGVVDGDNVVVIGAGPIGLFAALGALDRGGRVMVADRVANRLKHATRLGAVEVVDTTTDDLRAANAEFTDGEGAAVIIEATGVPSLIRLAVDLVAHSGTVVVVGLSKDQVAIPVTEFSRKELNMFGSRNNAGLFAAAVDMVTRYADLIAPLVTHVFPLTQVPQAIDFARTHPHEVEKVVIHLAD